MSKDYLLDVLNELDEDLVIETARKRSHFIKRSHKWVFPAAMAASFVLFVSVFFYTGGFELFAQNSESILSSPENDIYYTIQDTYSYESESIEGVKELPSVIITLDRWTNDGFEGTVSAYVDTEAIPIGSKVFVKTDEHTSYLTVADDLTDDEALKIQADTSSSKPITLCVKFHMAESEVLSSFMDDSESVYYLHADQVWPTDTVQEMEGLQ